VNLKATRTTTLDRKQTILFDMNAEAEKTKRQLLVGRLMSEFGDEKIIEILKDLKEPYRIIDEHFKNIENESKGQTLRDL